MEGSVRPTQLSVVIPVYNEERVLPETLRRVEAFLSLKPYSWEILVADDGSTDGTRRIVESYRTQNERGSVRRVGYEHNRGKGAAVREGVRHAAGRYVLVTDADLSAPIKESDKLLAALEAGAAVAIGSRAVARGDCDVRQSAKRRFAGRIFNGLVCLIVMGGFKDTQCGFKMFTKEAASSLFAAQKIDGFSFDVEVLYLAKKMGLVVREVPVMWQEGSSSKIRLMRDSIRMVRELFKIRRWHG